MDYTIEVWTIEGNHFAECICGWCDKSLYQALLEQGVRGHKAKHTENGDYVEVV